MYLLLLISILNINGCLNAVDVSVKVNHANTNSNNQRWWLQNNCHQFEMRNIGKKNSQKNGFNLCIDVVDFVSFKFERNNIAHSKYAKVIFSRRKRFEKAIDEMSFWLRLKQLNHELNAFYVHIITSVPLNVVNCLMNILKCIFSRFQVILVMNNNEF